MPNQDSLAARTKPPQAGRPAMAALAPEAVRAHDIRGLAGRQVTAPGVQALGLSYATQARARGLSRIGVGRDGRLSSLRLERALVRGLVEGGMTVDRIGVCATPKLGFAVRQLGLDGAIMVTASHNPAPENGLKLMLGRERIHGDALKALVAAEGRPVAGGGDRPAQVEDAYLATLLAAARGMAPLTVAWDCGNGATGAVLEELVRRLPGRHVLINSEIDGRFPNHHADPAVSANLIQLQSMVRAQGCDLGIAFDGDGDRIGVVDGTGATMAADHLLLFLAQDLLKRRPGAAVVGDVKSSRLLFDGVRAAGGRPVMAPCGYVLVRQALQREGALLAGELSGHIFFADEWDGPDDALYAAMRLLRILSGGGPSLAEFRRALPQTYATAEMRVACEDAPGIVRAMAASSPETPFDPAMGLRRENPDGWWLIRASGTEPKITCRCESASEEGLRRLAKGLVESLRRQGVDAAWPQSL